MSKTIRLIGLLCAALCSQTNYAQDSVHVVMGIDEMFRLADENSVNIRASRTGIDIARHAVDAAKDQRLPDINASLSFSYLGDGFITDRDFSNGMHVDIPHFGNNFAFEASQVVYSGGAITSGIKLAELSEQMAQLDYQRNVQDTRFLLLGHLLNISKLNNHVKVLNENIALTKLVIKNMEDRFREGIVLKNDITRYELQLENLLLQLARVQYACEVANHQLVTTLHLPAETVIVPDTTMFASAITPQVENIWQQEALNSNISLMQSNLAIEINNQKLNLERSELLPKIAIVAEYHLDGPITIEVPTLNNNFNYWFVGVGIKYNISSLFKNNSNVRKARMQVVRAEDEQYLAHEHIDNAIHAAFSDYQTAFVDLRTQIKSQELADRNYNVINNRYSNDLALLTDMLDASNTKLDADLAVVNARINLVYNYYKMKYLTNTL